MKTKQEKAPAFFWRLCKCGRVSSSEVREGVWIHPPKGFTIPMKQAKKKATCPQCL